MKLWLGLLTAAVVLLAAGVAVGLASLSADVARLDAHLSGRIEADSPVPAEPSPAPVRLDAQVMGTHATTTTFAVTLTVRFSGPADLLAEPPVLQGGGKTYPATPDSLALARFAFLDLISKGTATVQFVFEGAPDEQDALRLVFNPASRPQDVIAPRREVFVR